jgi:hypothetical protein
LIYRHKNTFRRSIDFFFTSSTFNNESPDEIFFKDLKQRLFAKCLNFYNLSILKFYLFYVYNINLPKVVIINLGYTIKFLYKI